MARQIHLLCGLLIALGLNSAPATEPDLPASIDAMQARGGEIVHLPFRRSGVIDHSQCIEFEALETGLDVQLILEIDDRHLKGSDGSVSRRGLQVLAYCNAAEAMPFTVKVEAIGQHPDGAARFSATTIAAKGANPWASLAAAFVAVNDPAGSREAAVRFAESAQQFDSANDLVHAAIAWFLAVRMAEVALERPLAEQAFKAARERLNTLRWIRDEVVLLNNRALFISAEDATKALALIEDSYRLQQKLDDPLLSAAIENNVCLIRGQVGDLSSAESCFERIVRREETLGARPASLGAARNNWSLVRLRSGQYREAEQGFRQAASERLAGEDYPGYVISSGNLALCLYHQGRLGPALTALHATYDFAKQHEDAVGRAKIAEYLASVYLGWGDSDTARVFASEAEAIDRKGNRISDLAQVLRLRARIDAEHGDLDAALDLIKTAWSMAIDNRQIQAAANVAGVYADILLRRGDFSEAERFVGQAQALFRQGSEVHDQLTLQIADLRRLRATGNLAQARHLAQDILRKLPYPGLSRTVVLIEQYLAQDADGRSLARYQALLGEIRNASVLAPDPELAFRLLDVSRPAAEAVIADTLARCAASAACASDALLRALEYLSIKPQFSGQDGEGSSEELSGLLESLSIMQARGELSRAPEQLKGRIKQLQTVARMRTAAAPVTDCDLCSSLRDSGTHLVYFFGEHRSWRWHRTDTGWEVRELPSWPSLVADLRRFGEVETRRDALMHLSTLVADLPDYPSMELIVGGDERVSRFPLSALALNEQAYVVDKYAVIMSIGPRKAAAAASRTALFVGTEGAGNMALPMITEERAIVDEWSKRTGLSLEPDGGLRGTPLKLLHITAHGDRDVGAGLSILWLNGHPLLSYLFDDRLVADTVVINACESGAVGDFALSQSSIAFDFLRSGARHVIATLYPISDRSAAAFSKAFYASYDPGMDNLAKAVRDAQLSLKTSRRGGADWQSYILLSPQG